MNLLNGNSSDSHYARLDRISSILLTLSALALAAVPLSPVTVAAATTKKSRAPRCLGSRATIIGTPRKDKLMGTPYRDVIVGFGGNDRIWGQEGNDLICGGPGKDKLYGGKGNDRLAGNAHRDRIWGQVGNDTLYGHRGNDDLTGNHGRDLCRGGMGFDDLDECERGFPPHAHYLHVYASEDEVTKINVLAATDDTKGHRLKVQSLQQSGAVGAVAIGAGARFVLYNPLGRFASLALGQSRSDQFGYEVVDVNGRAARGSVSVSVKGVDDPPLAVSDFGSTIENEPQWLNAVANDIDGDGGPKEITAATHPSHGTASVAPDGKRILYQPADGYCNDNEQRDTVSYSLNGGSRATVQMAVSCKTKLTASPGLLPSFSPEITDYVVRCHGAPVALTGRTSSKEHISVDGGSPQSGLFSSGPIPLGENQAFSFLIKGDASTKYHVRCLPDDFPEWNYQRSQQPSHDFYVVTPTSAFGEGASRYIVLFDDYGAPVWWHADSPKSPVNGSVLEDGTVVWWGSPEGSAAYELRGLDGSLQIEIRPVSGALDLHEFQVTPNGNFLILATHEAEHVDLTAVGGGPDEAVLHADIEEVTPHGALVWEWSTEGHVGLSETGRWWPFALAVGGDIVHPNAIEPVGNDAVLLSLRHTDAVYKIDKATGDIVWKLGGTWTPESLTVANDPQGAYPLGGQHDVRLQVDGTITVHDNNTNFQPRPRAVRYAIDEASESATLVEQVTDPDVTDSRCCGSARRSSDGSWLMSWGGNSLVTEFDAAIQRNFRLDFGGAVFSYRGVSVPDGALSIEAIREGMSGMFPRP